MNSDSSAECTPKSAAFSRRSGWLGKLPEPTALEWFVLVAGAFLTIHYAWIMDDAFVYFRYVDNLLFLDSGLVYNQGEYVEGYSSALWCLLLVALRATTLDYWLMVRFLGLAIWGAFWLLGVQLNRRLTPEGLAPFNAPLLFLGANYGVLCYFTSGLETPLVQLAALLFAFGILNAERLSWPLVLALALTPLVRYELVVPLGLLWLYSFYRTRRVPWLLGLFSAGLMGAWLLFKVYYYAELLPNTFYLKDNLDLSQGLIYVNDTLWPYGVYLALPLLLGLFTLIAKRQRSFVGLYAPQRALMFLCALCIAAYVVKIGGDPRHFRYLAFPFCLGAVACGGLVEQLLAKAPFCRRPRLFGIGFGLLLFAGSLLLMPRQISGHPLFMDDHAEFVQKIGDASNHRHAGSLAFLRPWGPTMESSMHMFERYEKATAKGPFRYKSVETGDWCFANYRNFDRRIVHDLGLTDAILAHVKMGFNRPAHKLGLIPLAGDLQKLYRALPPGKEPGLGTIRKTNAQQKPPIAWITKNQATIDLIERKVYNRHDFLENLELAFEFPPQMHI